MKASLGRVVIINGISSNGANEHPAIINRVWSDADPGEATVLVNVVVFPDCASSPKSQGSVRLFNTKAEAVAAQQANPTSLPMVCWFPDRV